MRQRRRKGIMFQVVFAVLLSIFASGVQAENLEEPFTVSIILPTDKRKASQRSVTYLVYVRQGHGDKWKQGAESFVKGLRALEPKIKELSTDGCTEAFRNSAWDIIAPLAEQHSVSVHAKCSTSTSHVVM